MPEHITHSSTSIKWKDMNRVEFDVVTAVNGDSLDQSYTRSNGSLAETPAVSRVLGHFYIQFILEIE